MIFRQITHDDLGCASYLIGDEDAGVAALNRGPLWRESTEAQPLAPRQVDSHQRDGALVIDVRTELQFDEAHIPGALCITALRAGFGSKLAWLADPSSRS